MSASFDFSVPSVVTLGTVGEPGQRIFFLQVRETGVLATLKLEKLQVAALAQHLGQMLSDLPRPAHLPDGDELDPLPFVEMDFVVGSLAVSYDEVADRIVLLAEELVREDAEEPDSFEALVGGSSAGSARVAMTREQAAAFAIRGATLVGAGRAPCPLCGYPLDARGHYCPKTNGYRAPLV
jgi:uncharacterized repeat protein (TIGR03847 family)